MKTVATIQGDTWDTVAYRVYGNVLRTQNLMEARENAPLLDCEVFSAGILISVPEIAEQTLMENLPEWRK